MIVAATPTRADVTAPFVGDLIKLCRRHPDLRWMASLGIYIHNLRNSCVSAAQQVGASHVLFLDSDMRFPADTLDRLLDANQRIVGANYVQRTMTHWWTARVEGEPVSSVGRSGLQEVHSLGCGVLLIDLTVFNILPEPWFTTPYDGKTHVGEDVQFCRTARAHGFTVWIDHDLSQSVRHQGTVELGVMAYAD